MLLSLLASVDSTSHMHSGVVSDSCVPLVQVVCRKRGRVWTPMSEPGTMERINRGGCACMDTVCLHILMYLLDVHTCTFMYMYTVCTCMYMHPYFQ